MNKTFELSRRSLLRGAAGAGGAAMLAACPGSRLIRAQEGGAYDIVALAEQTGIIFSGPQYGFPDLMLYGLSSSGETCGYVPATEDRTSPAVWSRNGKLRKLKSGKYGGYAGFINANGLVVGNEFDTPNSGTIGRAFAWLDGERIDFDAAIPQGASLVQPYGVNDLNQVLVGDASGRCIIATVESIDDISVVELEIPARYLANDGQLLTGSSIDDAKVVTFQAGFPDDVQTFEIELPDGVTGLDPKAIDASGRVLALAGEGEYQNPFGTIIVDGDELTLYDLRADGERIFCQSMNLSGAAAGFVYADDGSGYAAALVDGEVIDLNDLVPAGFETHLERAFKINDEGVILAGGLVEDFAHYFLLVPAEA